MVRSYDLNHSILLNLFVLWPSICCILEIVPCSLEKNVYSAIVRWSVLYIDRDGTQSSFPSLLIFCLAVLSNLFFFFPQHFSLLNTLYTLLIV